MNLKLIDIIHVISLETSGTKYVYRHNDVIQNNLDSSETRTGFVNISIAFSVSGEVMRIKF